MAAIQVGLVGYGLAGRVFHAPLIQAVDGLELAAVVTSREVQVGGAEVVRELDALVARSELVVVATPNRAHVPTALAALQQGRHVVVDKPLAVSAPEAERLLAHAEGRVTVFQNRRWDGDFLTVRRRLPELGKIVRFESRYERFRPEVKEGAWRELGDPQEGGGLLLDLGAHLIDQAVVLFGPPEQVYAEVRRVRPGALADDDVFLALRHAGAVISHLFMSSAAPLHGPRFRVSGLGGGLAIDGIDPQEAQLERGLRPGDPGYGTDPERGDLEPGDYAAFYRGVVAWMRAGAPPPVDPADAVAALRVIDAARGSS